MTLVIYAKYYSNVRVMCFWCEEGLEMCDFRVDGLIMIGFVLVAVLLIADDGHRMAGFELAAHVLCVRMTTIISSMKCRSFDPA